MNQGNSEEFMKNDGVWQDGGMLLHFPLMVCNSIPAPSLQ
jgi:uncharacterized protein YukJ